MSDHSITSLIEKLEGAEVGSRELDALVHVAVANDPNTYVVGPAADSIFSHKPGWYRTGNDLSCLADPVTTSLDAALALAERVLPGDPDFSPTGPSVGWKINLYRGMVPAPLGGWIVNLRRHATDGFEGQATTAALALCAAILRARSEARV